MTEGTGRNLEPTKFGIKPGSDRSVSPSTKPDQFGQVNSAEKDFTGGQVPSAREVTALHSKSDADSSGKALHHTLGNNRNQSARGDHVHDGINGKKLALYQMTSGGGAVQPSLVLTGAKGGNVALANLIALLKNFIDFTDNTT